ncbi:hypothetical protein K6168_01285 [Streptomyces sp. FB2]|uniref:hypothetical protein n=1 Tax=Streptomyces sp. FB2 TaxID=2902454 RepID=UPI001F3FDB1D|nr:hypothetical protein [Streptomyces sp. FB2]MCF2534312.1 hypothetical protein [Streptomyces sp. FB2]
MKALKSAGYGFGGLSGLYAAYYTVLYLTRWEWQRALISALMFLIIEVLLATILLLSRFARLNSRLDESVSRMEDVRSRLEQTRDPVRGRFDWLAPADPDELRGTQRTFVFVPVLMVAGAALSGLATILQKVAGATVGRGAERRLAGRLTALTVPPVGGTDMLESRPAVPSARPVRRATAVAAAVGGLLLVPFLWSALADATQTRPEPAPRTARSTVTFEVKTRGSLSADTRLAAYDLWQTCRRSTAALNQDAHLTEVRHGVYVAVIRPALPPHDMMRLRGCIQDANTNRTSAVVLR